MAAAMNSRHSCSSSRYSSNCQRITANHSSSKLSPVKLVACSQKVSCQPANSTALIGGTHATQPVRKEKLLRSRVRSISVRSCGSSATERASTARVAAPQSAERRFKANGMCPVGNQRNGRVTSQVSGLKICGCQVQPETAATWPRFSSVTQWFKVSQ